MHDPWKPDTAAPEPWQHGAPPTDLSHYDGIVAVNEALFALGVMKPGERITSIHAHACLAGRSQLAACSCPGGPELVYADWDELHAQRHYVIPERFHEHH